MTKAEEIKILSAAAKKLGNDSYCGDALLRLIPHLEMSIRSDICPNLVELVSDYEKRADAAHKACADMAIVCAAKSNELKEMERKLNCSRDELYRLEESIENAKWKAIDALNALKGLIPDALLSLACKS